SEPELDHREEERCEQQPRDEDELDRRRPAVARQGPASWTALTALENTSLNNGVATPMSVTTSIALMTVTRTQPGTSPRSGSSSISISRSSMEPPWIKGW